MAIQGPDFSKFNAQAFKAMNVNTNMPKTEVIKLVGKLMKEQGIDLNNKNQVKQFIRMAKTIGNVDSKNIKIISKALLNPEQTRVHGTVRLLGAQALTEAGALAAGQISAGTERHRIDAMERMASNSANKIANNYTVAGNTREEDADKPGLQDGGWN